MKLIYVLGIGHNTPVFIDLALACGYKIAGLYHYNNERTGNIDHGFKVLGSFDDLLAQPSLGGKCFLLTMGDNEIRFQLCKKIINKDGCVPSLIHPTCVISHFADISPVGVYISPFTYVQADSVIGDNTVLLSHVNISHNTKIGKNCFIAGGSTIGAYTTVEDFVFVGQGVLSISSKVNNIGHHSYIGAGSLITHDISSESIVVGRPARIFKKSI
ncbi:LbetaH domain-containing protein [Phocaeicola sartorii]|uniref:transferase n=1 Tax=Phocaeicola sartorii TaxID=671267 RepID=UPI001F5AFBD6|nr:transferase [Phocaeicola sartorii]